MATKKKRAAVAPSEPPITAAQLKTLMEAYASLTGAQIELLKAFGRLEMAGERASRGAVAKESGRERGAAQGLIKELWKKEFLEPIKKPTIVGYKLTKRAKACLKMVR